MSETKFTKGEWVAKDNGYYFDIHEVDSLGYYLDQVCMGVPYENKGNVPLIAAAPKLYHALKRTNEELALLIDLYNKEVNDPAHFIDAETCYLNNIELAKARGEK